MKINCDTIMDGWLGEPPSGQQQKTECGKPATVLIVTEQTPVLCMGIVDGCHNTRSVDLLTVHPVCADHAPEAVHEARSSMSEDEYAIVNLPAEATPVRFGEDLR